MSCDPHWITYSAALLTPIIALFSAYIAYRQWRTAHNKLKLDLFKHRFSVYDAARTLLASIITSGKVKDEELFNFLSGTREAKWLLDGNIAEYLEKELYHKAIDLQCLASELEVLPDGDDRSLNIHKQAELKKWFLKQYEVLDEKFSPFLKLEY